MKRSTWESIITVQAVVILALVGYAFWRHTVSGLITEMELGSTLSRSANWEARDHPQQRRSPS